ncbi:MAG TPA: c-type cytochrome [Thermoanaerobaculia bacterium]|nr:c-type cytochrome [Thermoanaerobaculia bacterium]
MIFLLALLLSADPPADPPVETTKKNIKVLHGLPSSQLIPVMAVMSNSLGVACSHCHTEDWSSDEKPPKNVARKMIAMTRSINDANFEGRVRVSCHTCHRGSVRPMSIPLVANAGWNKTPIVEVERVLPDAKVLFEKAGPPPTLLGTGVVSARSGRGDPRSAAFELLPEEIKTELRYPPDAHGGYPRDPYASMVTKGVEEIRGRTAYVVEAMLPGAKRTERLYFDAATGVLLRRHRERETIIGVLPEEFDFDDHRTVNGALVPHLVQWSRADYQVTFRFAAVRSE